MPNVSITIKYLIDINMECREKGTGKMGTEKRAQEKWAQEKRAQVKK